MDDLLSGSPADQSSFRYKVIGDPLSPAIKSPRRSTGQERIPGRFAYRVPADPPPPSPPDPLHSSYDELSLVLPDFDVSQDNIAGTSLAPSRTPTLSQVAKTAAVSALQRHGRDVKPLCDRIYGRFFEAITSWGLAAMRRRAVPRKVPLLDPVQVAEARDAMRALEDEIGRWERCETSVGATVRGGARLGLDEDKDKDEVDMEALESMIVAVDEISRDVGCGMAQAFALDEKAEEIAGLTRQALL